MASKRGKQPSRNKPSTATGKDRRLKANRKPGQAKPGPKPKRKK